EPRRAAHAVGRAARDDVRLAGADPPLPDAGRQRRWSAAERLPGGVSGRRRAGRLPRALAGGAAGSEHARRPRLRTARGPARARHAHRTAVRGRRPRWRRRRGRRSRRRAGARRAARRPRGARPPRPRDARRAAQATVVPVVTPYGETVGAAAVLRDITLLKELQQMKDDFVHAVSHDLKGPISAIAGVAYLLQHDRAEDAQYQDRVRRLRDTAQAMGELVSDLLD